MIHRSSTTSPDDTALAALGWDATFAHAFTPHRAAGLTPARVVAEHRDRYVVADGRTTRDATLAGRLRHERAARHELPAVGDWVALAPSGDGPTVIRATLPRRGAFVRKAAGSATEGQVVAANVDVAMVATALAGDLNARRLERYLALAWESGATPVVVLTKADLCDDVPAALAAAAQVAVGVDVLALSAVSGDGVGALARFLVPGRTAVLLGSSGVGKSTLVNRLAGEERLRTGEVREDGRGRHTTTHRELVRLEGGALLIDTPGMRELQLWDADDGLGATFADVEALGATCRFRDCAHAGEPGCAVLDAVASGALDAERLESWRRLRRELERLERRHDTRLAAEANARARQLHRAANEVMKGKYGRR